MRWIPTVAACLVLTANNGCQKADPDLKPRGTINLSWSPIPRIDLVSEFLWGRRINKDGQRGKARQIQLGTTFRF